MLNGDADKSGMEFRLRKNVLLKCRWLWHSYNVFLSICSGM